MGLRSFPLIHPYVELTYTKATREVCLPAARCVGFGLVDCGGVWIGRTQSHGGESGEEAVATRRVLTLAAMVDVLMAAIENRFGAEE